MRLLLLSCAITFTILATKLTRSNGQRYSPMLFQGSPFRSHIMGQLSLPIPMPLAIPIPMQSQVSIKQVPVSNSISPVNTKQYQHQNGKSQLPQRGRTVMVPFDNGVPIVIELPPHVFSLSKESTHGNSYMRGLPTELREQLPFILRSLQQQGFHETPKKPVSRPLKTNTFGIPQGKQKFTPLNMSPAKRPQSPSKPLPSVPLPSIPPSPAKALSKVPSNTFQASSFNFGNGKTRDVKMNTFFIMKPFPQTPKQSLDQQKIHQSSSPQFPTQQQHLQITEKDAMKKPQVIYRGPNLVPKPPNFNALMDKVSIMMKSGGVKGYNQFNQQSQQTQIPDDGQPFREYPLSFNTIQTRKNMKNPYRPQQSHQQQQPQPSQQPQQQTQQYPQQQPEQQQQQQYSQQQPEQQQQQQQPEQQQKYGSTPRPTRPPTISPPKVSIYFEQPVFTTPRPHVKEIRRPSPSPPPINLVQVKVTLPPSPANKGRSLPKNNVENNQNQNDDDEGFYGVFDPPAFGKPFPSVGPTIQQEHNNVHDQRDNSDREQRQRPEIIPQTPISYNQSPIDVPHQPSTSKTIDYQNVRSFSFDNTFSQQTQKEDDQYPNLQHQRTETKNSFKEQFSGFNNNQQPENRGHFNKEIPVYEIDIPALQQQQRQFHHQQQQQHQNQQQQHQQQQQQHEEQHQQQQQQHQQQQHQQQQHQQHQQQQHQQQQHQQHQQQQHQQQQHQQQQHQQQQHQQHQQHQQQQHQQQQHQQQQHQQQQHPQQFVEESHTFKEIPQQQTQQLENDRQHEEQQQITRDRERDDNRYNIHHEQQQQQQHTEPSFPPPFPGHHQKSVSPLPLGPPSPTTIDEPYDRPPSPTSPTLLPLPLSDYDRPVDQNQNDDGYADSFDDDYQSEISTLAPLTRKPFMNTFTRSPTAKPSYQPHFASSKPVIKSVITPRPTQAITRSRSALRKLQFGSRIGYQSTTIHPLTNSFGNEQQFDDSQYVEPDAQKQHDSDTNYQQNDQVSHGDDQGVGDFEEYDQEQDYGRDGQQYDDNQDSAPDQQTIDDNQQSQGISDADDGNGSHEQDQYSQAYDDDSSNANANKPSSITRKPLPSPKAFQQFHYQPVRTKTDHSRTSSYMGKSAKSR